MKSTILGAACVGILIAASGAAQAASIPGQGTWESTLQGRDLDGNPLTFEAYYDTTLDITWLANANAGAGSAFDDGFNTTDGRMTWASANAWAAGLDVNGITGWRLPTNTPINGTSFNTTLSTNGTTDRGTATTTTDGSDGGWRDGSGNPVSEMGHMFYVTLGNLGAGDPSLPWFTSQSGSGLSNTGPFGSNVRNSNYWSGSALDSSIAWVFIFNSGLQDVGFQSSDFFAWAVRSGDVGASVVPVPAAAWLFASGLLGLVGVARKRRR